MQARSRACGLTHDGDGQFRFRFRMKSVVHHPSLSRSYLNTCSPGIGLTLPLSTSLTLLSASAAPNSSMARSNGCTGKSLVIQKRAVRIGSRGRIPAEARPRRPRRGSLPLLGLPHDERLIARPSSGVPSTSSRRYLKSINALLSVTSGYTIHICVETCLTHNAGR